MKTKIIKGKGQEDLINFLKKSKVSAKVGWFPDAKYDDKKGTQVAQVAASNEFGTSRIPARAFMRPTMIEKKNEWGEFLLRLSKEAIKNGASLFIPYESLSLKAADDFRKAITDLTSPELKESTIKRRISGRKKKAGASTIEKPLVDSGIMLQTLTSLTISL